MLDSVGLSRRGSGMAKINVRKEPDGWRAYIKDGPKVVVVDGFFEDEIEASRAALGVMD